MAYLVAVEHDAKCADDISASWKDLAQQLGHEFLLFKTLLEMRTELKKPEYLEKTFALALLPLEEVQQHATTAKADPAVIIAALNTELKCDILITCFDDPLKPIRSKNWRVSNIIYKPFDTTILKELTNFALNPGQKTKTQFVHNAQIESEIEIIKKTNLIELSEFGFKVDKTYHLNVGSTYKFYNPLFENKKADLTLMHTWAVVLSESKDHYELCFCQNNAGVLSQVRKRVASPSSQKVRHPAWQSPQPDIFVHAHKKSLTVALQLSDATLLQALQDLLNRNFKNLSFIEMTPVVHDSLKPALPVSPVAADLLITESAYDLKNLTLQFGPQPPVIVRLTDEVLNREKIELRWPIETLRCDSHVDKAHLIKALSLLFPHLEHGAEEIHRASVRLNENISLSELVKANEFSEAAISLLSPDRYEPNQMIDLALPHDDESQIKEMRAQVHFSDTKLTDKRYQTQVVLFGVRDEILKELRLWTLQQHIAKQNKAS